MAKKLTKLQRQRLYEKLPLNMGKVNLTKEDKRIMKRFGIKQS